ncbi:MAG TPA: DMT family transporter [Ktedonobacteraceae bacterium]|nr:DMT family transporter [Ktedonobacteraceae bacterium]
MKLSQRQGITLALVAAIVSGVSIYVNKFGVAHIRDPFVYTTVKNSVVVVGLLAAVGLLASWKELRSMTPARWLAWIGLGVIGGGVPFLLFFQGLTTASAASASLLQKTLFLWVALLAVPFLKEHPGPWQVLGLVVLAVSQFLLQPLTHWHGWGSGETLILIATLLWAMETILAKKVLGWMSPTTAALGRMGIGALVMWGFLAFTGRATMALTLNGTQWLWVVVTALFLLGYVWTWYSALKAAPASLVTSLLTIGAIVTILLTALFNGQTATAPQITSMALLVLGGALLVLPSKAWRHRKPEVA